MMKPVAENNAKLSCIGRMTVGKYKILKTKDTVWIN